MRLLLSFFLLFAITATAQQVPSKMTVAGVKVTISERLRQDLQKEVDALTASPKYFRIKVDRADIYFPIIEKIFAEENVPDDIKYLVLQESALIPDAVSVSNAVGYWQFKDFTAMEMGLRVDKQIDERMHIIASTRSAAQYMKKNYTYFNNWLYAIQAYQMGAGGAMKVVDKSHYGSKFMSLDHNTYWYLKKFIAHKIAFEPAVTGNSSIVLDIYDRASNKTLEQVAKEMSVDYENLVAYNAWLRKGRIPDDKLYAVILPVSHNVARPAEIKIENIISTTASVPEHIVVSEQHNFPVVGYKKPLFSNEQVKTFNGIPGIKAGENQTVVKLAAAGDVRLNKFLRNNDIDVTHKPKAGQVYYYKRKKAKADIYYHIVMHDETLWDISQKYGIRLKRLMHKNRLLSGENIKAGLVLWLRHVRPDYVPAEYKNIPENKKQAPEVQEVQVIAKRKEKEVEQVKKPAAGEVQYMALSATKDDKEINLLPDTIADNNIDIDENTDEKIGADTSEEVNYISHVIQYGETLYSISKKYDVQVVDLLTWNNIKAADKLSLGQEIKILQQKDVNAQEELLNLQDKDGLTHTVQAGETLYRIAGKYKVTVEDLMEWNGKSDSSLSVGEILQIKKQY